MHRKPQHVAIPRGNGNGDRADPAGTAGWVRTWAPEPRRWCRQKRKQCDHRGRQLAVFEINTRPPQGRASAPLAATPEEDERRPRSLDANACQGSIRSGLSWEQPGALTGEQSPWHDPQHSARRRRR